MRKRYIAYGSNLNIKQMKERCPTASIVGSGILPDYKLAFCGVATVLPNKGDRVPIGVWEIDEECESALDIYEGYPRLYRKEYVEVAADGVTIRGLIYIMNRVERYPPRLYYYSVIRQGYDDFSLDHNYLRAALEKSD